MALFSYVFFVRKRKKGGACDATARLRGKIDKMRFVANLKFTFKYFSFLLFYIIMLDNGIVSYIML